MASVKIGSWAVSRPQQRRSFDLRHSAAMRTRPDLPRSGRHASISRMEEPEPSFTGLRVWDRSVLVLMDWLLTTDENSLPVTHPAQKQALRDLLTAIEWARGLGYTDAELAVAQEQVSSNMSDEDRGI
ncbi:MAG: hypothetical protein EOO27_28595 [Comamonadaceae bacterium]|nr:MAG: hypothetical protein EOO27_28595 [Comamonadaceae bacterium]